MANLALNESADATFRVANDLDILYLSMFRQMFRQQLSELLLVDIRWKAENYSNE